MTTLAHLVAELADRIGVTDPDEVRGRGARIMNPGPSDTPGAIAHRERRAKRRAEKDQDAA